MHFSKYRLGCHQRVQKFKISLPIAWRTFNRFWIAIPNFKVKYEDSENVKADRINTVVFSLHEIKRQAFFLGHPVNVNILNR